MRSKRLCVRVAPGRPYAPVVEAAFEAGDLRRPYIIGACWNGRETLPEPPQAANNKRLIKTRAGSRVEFDDTEGAPKITISTKGGHTILLDDGAQDVKVLHSNGSVVKINIAGQVTITANATVEITASALNVHAAAAIFDVDWNSMFTSASGRCSGLSVPFARGIP